MERWKLDYYYRRGEDELVHDIKEIELPDGYYEKAKEWLAKSADEKEEPQDSTQDSGIIYKLDVWGVGLCVCDYNPYEVTFDLPQGTPRKGQIVSDLISMTQSGQLVRLEGKPLEDTTVIGSEEHPFRIYAPNGELMGTYTTWASFRTKTQEKQMLEEIKAANDGLKL